MNCEHCTKEINNKGSWVAHQRTCKSNPNRISFYHSPNAGRKKGCKSPTEGRKMGPHPKWRQLFPNEKIFVENGTYDRVCVKRRILQDNLKPYVCAICGQLPEWCDKPMPLILDHINGINNDNRLENLRFVCGHCDSQLPTYKSKNRKR